MLDEPIVRLAHQLNKATDPTYNLALALATQTSVLGRFLAEEDGMLTFTDSGTYDECYLQARGLITQLERQGFRIIKGDEDGT